MGWKSYEDKDVSVLLPAISPTSRPLPGAEQARMKYILSELVHFSSCWGKYMRSKR